jgi:hypothetical protein
MNRSRLIAATSLAAALSLASLGAAGAQEQTVNATVANSITMSTAPASAVNLGSLAQGPNAWVSGGSVGVKANLAYTVTVAGAALTHATDGPMLLPLDARADGLAGVAVTELGTPLVASVLPAVLGTEETHPIDLSQTVSAIDPAGAYSTTLTYTVAASL